MHDKIVDGEAMADVEGVDATDLVGSRRAQRAKEHTSAQHCIRAMVDYLAISALASKPPRRISDIAQQVIARTEALAAAREFIADCEAGPQ